MWMKAPVGPSAGSVARVHAGLRAVDDSAGLRQQTLFADDMVFLCRKGHPRSKKPLDLAAYLELRHVLVSLRGGSQSAIDARLAETGHRREVALIVPHFLAALLIVSVSELVLTAPARIVEQLGEALALKVMAPPLPDPAHLWLRQEIFAAAQSLRAPAAPRPSRARG